MNACDHCRDDLLDLLYKELGPEREREARQHLAACPECAREFAELQKTLSAVRTLADPEPPAYLNTRVKAIIAEAGSGTAKRSWWSWVMSPRLAMAALVVIAVSVGVVMYERGAVNNVMAPLAETGDASDMRNKEVALLTPSTPSKTEAPDKDDTDALGAVSKSGGRDDFATLDAEVPAEEATAPASTPTVGYDKSEEKSMVLKMGSTEDTGEAHGNKVEEPTRDEEIAPPAPDLVAKNEQPPNRAVSDREGSGRERDMAKEKETKKPEKPQAKPTAGPPGPPAATAPETAPSPAPVVEPEKRIASDKKADLAKDEPVPAGQRGAGGPEPKAPAEPETISSEDQDKFRARGYTSEPESGVEADGVTKELADDMEEKQQTGSSPLAQAQALEAEGKYKKALELYERELARLGYDAKPAGKKKPADAYKQPAPTAGEGGGTAEACTSDLKAATDGAIRCYRKLLMFGKAKKVEDWRRTSCQ